MSNQTSRTQTGQLPNTSAGFQGGLGGLSRGAAVAESVVELSWLCNLAGTSKITTMYRNLCDIHGAQKAKGFDFDTYGYCSFLSKDSELRTE